MVGVPELGADKDLLTGSASLLKPAADSTATGLLVSVASGRVDVTVARVKCSSDGILGLLAIRGLVDSESNLRDVVAIVELDGRDRAAMRTASDVLLDED